MKCCPYCETELGEGPPSCCAEAELRHEIHEIMTLIPFQYREPIRDDGEIESLKASVENMVEVLKTLPKSVPIPSPNQNGSRLCGCGHIHRPSERCGER